jgi:hypothetical protein
MILLKSITTCITIEKKKNVSFHKAEEPGNEVACCLGYL